ncbi:MAG: T9SS type A sorting domain-containing protein [Bacteroidetes bacterium]|nr:T9SS type A sorting domain-containing protein [Bacteroidota bacterium]
MSGIRLQLLHLLVCISALPATSRAQLPIDSSYGFNGLQFINGVYGGKTRLYGLTATLENRCVALIGETSGSSLTFYLSGRKADGSVDSAFGYNGIAPLGIYGTYGPGEYGYGSQPAHLETDSAGNIYTWGDVVSMQGSLVLSSSWLQRYTPDGWQDTSFHPLLDFTKWMPSKGSVLFKRALHGKYYFSVANDQGRIMRIGANNKPDSSFGGDGMVDSIPDIIIDLFENANGSFNVFTTNPSYQCMMHIFNKNGVRDKFRTTNGFLSVTCGEARPLYPHGYVISTLDYTKYPLVKNIWYKDVFTAFPGIPSNGRTQSRDLDTNYMVEAGGIIPIHGKHYAGIWNRYSRDDNNFYIDYKGGITFYDSAGQVYPTLPRSGNPYLLPQRKDNHKVKYLASLPDGSLLAGMDIWNRGDFSALLVKYLKPVFPDKTTAVQIRNKPQFSVLPNPSRGEFVVQLPENHAWEVRITDLSGKLLREYSCQSTTRLELRSNLSPGVYLLTLSRKGMAGHTEKIIIE